MECVRTCLGKKKDIRREKILQLQLRGGRVDDEMSDSTTLRNLLGESM